jgi:hypothetical protein
MVAGLRLCIRNFSAFKPTFATFLTCHEKLFGTLQNA